MNDLTKQHGSHEQPHWYCERCSRNVSLDTALQRQWGHAIAIICPTCQERLGELRWTVSSEELLEREVW